MQAIRLLFSIGWNPSPAPFAFQRPANHQKQRFFGRTFIASTTSNSEAEAEDLLRWERMYAEGIRSTTFGMGIEQTSKKIIRSKVHVVTYDLDNTLWNTSATIGIANDALASHISLKCGGIDDQAKNITRVEERMRALHQAKPHRYGPTVPTTTESSNLVVRLTDLRKDAIRSVLIHEAGYADDDPRLETDVEEAFGVWVDARHKCIPAHFAESGVLECLQAIRQSPDVVAIGAITDGNSDPMAIAELECYFDFCINAEQVGIGKPDRRIYQRAVHHVLEMHPWLRSKASQWNDDDIDAVGPWWVHVGDDFVKDIVAAKSFGMRCIWSRELILEKLKTEQLSQNRSSMMRDVETFVKEISEMEIIQMEIGADDYLLESLQKEFADDVVDRFIEVSQTIDRWQTEAALDESDDVTETTRVNQLPGRRTENDLQDQAVDVLPDQKKVKVVQNAQTSGKGNESKFCIFCGTKLPSIAKFCFSCGQKQV